jgi:hypothetical protein
MAAVTGSQHLGKERPSAIEYPGQVYINQTIPFLWHEFPYWNPAGRNSRIAAQDFRASEFVSDSLRTGVPSFATGYVKLKRKYIGSPGSNSSRHLFERAGVHVAEHYLSARSRKRGRQ